MKIKGIANWASILVPNTRYDPVYCIDLTINKEQADALMNQGLRPKVQDDGSYVIKFKRNVHKKDGTYNNKPSLVDSQMNPMSASVGNGSEVIVQYSTFEWNNKFGAGVGADLSGVQVLKLIEYRAGDGEEFEKEEGFVTSTPKETVAAVKQAPPSTDDFDDDIPF